MFGREETAKPELSAIRRAISQRELWVAYQPIVDLKTGVTFAYEALARSKAPELKGPLDLMKAAIADGCIGELGHVLRQMTMEGSQGTPLFVNINPNEFDQGWLVRPDDPLFWHDETVYLEITESVPLSHFAFCSSVLAEIRSKGVRLVIDDFGAGYSNIKYISELTPDVVKLDMDLVQGISKNPRQFQLVRSITRLCDDMNSKVVGEGVEELDDLKALRDCGVHYGQGYLLAKPASPPPEAVWPTGLR